MNKKDLRNIFSINLKKFLQLHHKTRKQMAEELFISYTRICDWSRARTYPTDDELALVAGYFSTSISSLTKEIKFQNNEVSNDKFIFENNEKIDINIYDIKSGIIYGKETVSTRYIDNKNCIHIMFFIEDDLMFPQYQAKDLILAKNVTDINEICDGDYLISDETQLEKHFMHIYVKDDSFIITPLNINNEKCIMPQTISKETILKKYALFKAVSFTRKI